MEKPIIESMPSEVKIEDEKIFKRVLDRIKKLFINDSNNKDSIQKEAGKIEREEIIEDYKEEGFDIEEKLKEVNGPYVEVAGPTPGGYDLVDINNLGKKLHVSNAFSRLAKGKIDFKANAKELPLKNESVGALFVSCLGGIQRDDPEELKLLEKKVGKNWVSNKTAKRYDELSYQEKRKLRERALEEAYRSLEDGGILIWQGGEKEDVETAKELNFKIKELKDNKKPGTNREHPSYNFIFEK